MKEMPCIALSRKRKSLMGRTEEKRERNCQVTVSEDPNMDNSGW